MFGFSQKGFAVLLNDEIENYGLNTKKDAIKEAEKVLKSLTGDLPPEEMEDEKKSIDIEIIKYEKIDW